MPGHIIVVGAGVGGLSAALELACAGYRVTVLERDEEPGGKMRQISVAGVGIDAGPTVFTMRWVFEALFQVAGTTLEAQLRLQQASVLARHAWREGGELDLHADSQESARAIEAFAGPDDARGYLEFCRRSADVYNTLREPFIASQRPGMLDLVRRIGLRRLDALWRTAPFGSLWSTLGSHFSDPRMLQLFGRYATYVGSSPLSAPATLMLIAHVEQDGVWLVEGGMRAVAGALRRVAEEQGVQFHFGRGAKALLDDGTGVTGVETDDGEQLGADAIVFNGDVSALGGGLLGSVGIRQGPPVPRKQRALSAITCCILGEVSGFRLHYHNVFFAGDYPEEFAAIFGRGEITRYPTVYLCAQDRIDGCDPVGPERLLLLINAPADGDSRVRDDEALASYLERALSLLRECGCHIGFRAEHCVTTDPAAFHQRFPGSGGSLYGRATHGMFASFQRPGSHSAIPRLYLAGGSAHPGAGVPMAAMSGRLAAAAVLADLG